MDTKATIKHLEEVIKSAKMPLPEDKEALKKFRKMVTNPVIGQVYLASGVHVSDANRRLDWALVSTPGTFTKNKPTPKSVLRFSPGAEPSSAQGSFKQTEDSVVRSVGQVKRGEWVTKNDRCKCLYLWHCE